MHYAHQIPAAEIPNIAIVLKIVSSVACAPTFCLDNAVACCSEQLADISVRVYLAHIRAWAPLKSFKVLKIASVHVFLGSNATLQRRASAFSSFNPEIKLLKILPLPWHAQHM